MTKKPKQSADWSQILALGRRARLRLRTLCKWANKPDTLLNSDPREVINDLAETVNDLCEIGKKKL